MIIIGRCTIKGNPKAPECYLVKYDSYNHLFLPVKFMVEGYCESLFNKNGQLVHLYERYGRFNHICKHFVLDITYIQDIPFISTISAMYMLEQFKKTNNSFYRYLMKYELENKMSAVHPELTPEPNEERELILKKFMAAPQSKSKSYQHFHKVDQNMKQQQQQATTTTTTSNLSYIIKQDGFLPLEDDNDNNSSTSSSSLMEESESNNNSYNWLSEFDEENDMVISSTS